MLVGSRPINVRTDLHDLANLAKAYDILERDWQYKFDSSMSLLFGNIRSFLDSTAKRIGLWNWKDMVDNDTMTDDYVTWLFVSSTLLNNGDECTLDQAVWTFECIVGWVLWDSFVTFAYAAANHSSEEFSSTACTLASFKNDWHNAQRDSRIRELQRKANAYDNVVAQTFYTESGSILD